jgi:hypothetical protein
MIGRELGNLAHDHPYDALKTARGPVLHFLNEPMPRQWGDQQIFGRFDATEVLREFSHWCALQMVSHYHDVRDYLATGDPALHDNAIAFVKSKWGDRASQVVAWITGARSAWPDEMAWAAPQAHWGNQRTKFKELVDNHTGA